MISIIITGYNNQKDLQPCLNGIHQSTYKNFQIIYCDGNSTDNSVEFVKKKYPKIKIIVSKENLGYGHLVNLGISFQKSDFYFILNSDTVIDKDCLQILVNNADNHTILQPLILIYKNNQKTNLINTTGNHLNFLGFSYCDNYLKDKNFVKSNQDITTASGAAMFIPQNVIKKTGLFDENYFMYHEDLDFCWRARLNNFNIKLIKDAIIWHKYTFSKKTNKFYFTEKNRLYFLIKNFTNKYLILIFPALLINEILVLFYALFNGWFILKIKSYSSLFKEIERTNPKTISTNYLSPEISFSEISNPLITPYNLFLSLYWRIIKPLV